MSKGPSKPEPTWTRLAEKVKADLVDAKFKDDVKSRCDPLNHVTKIEGKRFETIFYIYFSENKLG